MTFSTSDFTLLRIRCHKCGQHTEKTVTELMLDQARRAGQELTLLKAHAEVLQACIRHGNGEQDNSIVIEEIRRRTVNYPR